MNNAAKQKEITFAVHLFEENINSVVAWYNSHIHLSLFFFFFFFSCEKKQKTREENHLMEDKKKKKQEEKKKKDAAQKKVSLRRVLLSDTCASFSFHLPLPAVYSKNPFRFKEFNVSSFVATKKKEMPPETVHASTSLFLGRSKTKLL